MFGNSKRTVEADYDYFIGKYGSIYRAKKGTNGLTVKSRSNFGEVVNYTLGLGGITQLKYKEYITEVPLLMRNNSTLRGIGKGSIIKAMDGLDDSVIENYAHGTGQHDFLIEGLAIDGNKGEQANITDVVNGINLDYSYDWEIKNVFIKDVKEQSIRIGAGCHDGKIISPNIKDGDWTGIGLTYYNHDVNLTADKVHHVNTFMSKIKNCREFGADFEGAEYCGHLMSEGIIDCDVGLQLYQSPYCRLLDNYIEGSIKEAIRSYTSSQALIAINNIKEWDINNVGYSGIWLYSDRNHVTGNHTKSTHGNYSVNIDGGSWNAVIANWLDAYPMTAIRDNGISSVTEPNYPA